MQTVQMGQSARLLDTKMGVHTKVRIRGDMREADMKCKVAVWLLPAHSGPDTAYGASRLRSPYIISRLTRSRKLAAEGAFCCVFTSLFLFITGYFFTNH